MGGRSPSGEQVVLERLQWVHDVVQADLASGRERLVEGVLEIDAFVERCQVRLNPRGRICRRVRHGDGVGEKGGAETEFRGDVEGEQRSTDGDDGRRYQLTRSKGTENEGTEHVTRQPVVL